MRCFGFSMNLLSLALSGLPRHRQPDRGGEKGEAGGQGGGEEKEEVGVQGGTQMPISQVHSRPRPRRFDFPLRLLILFLLLAILEAETSPQAGTDSLDIYLRLLILLRLTRCTYHIWNNITMYFNAMLSAEPTQHLGHFS